LVEYQFLNADEFSLRASENHVCISTRCFWMHCKHYMNRVRNIIKVYILQFSEKIFLNFSFLGLSRTIYYTSQQIYSRNSIQVLLQELSSRSILYNLEYFYILLYIIIINQIDIIYIYIYIVYLYIFYILIYNFMIYYTYTYNISILYYTFFFYFTYFLSFILS